MSIQILSTYTKFATDGKRGGQAALSLVLLSGTTDKLLINNDKITQSDGGLLLLSSGTCNDLMLISGGTDNYLLSGTTDRLLIGGYCTSRIVQSQRRLKVSG